MINEIAIIKSVIKLIISTILEKKSNSFLNFLKKKYPPDALKKSAGKVAIPNKNIAKAAINGEEIAAAIRNALYKRPQGMKPRIKPKT